MHLFTGTVMLRVAPEIGLSIFLAALICPFELWSNFLHGKLIG